MVYIRKGESIVRPRADENVYRKPDECIDWIAVDDDMEDILMYM